MKLRVGSSKSISAFIVILGMIAALALPLMFNLLMPASTLTDTLSTSVNFNPPDSIYGFFDPEVDPEGTTYRWTTDEATVTFPYAANLGRQAVVAVRITDPRVGPATKEVVLSVNGGPPYRVDATNSFQTYTLPLDIKQFPNRYLDSANIQVAIETDTQATAQDARELGVAVDYVQVQMRRSNTEAVMEAVVWAVSLLAVLLIAISRFNNLWASIYGIAALATFSFVHLTYTPRAISLPVMVALTGVAWIIGTGLAPSRYPFLGIYTAILGLWLISAGRILGDWQVDDAYISYRYAWNLVNGNGLVYNPGEVVEGYTNFLWTMLAAGGLTLGLQPAGVMLAASITASLVLLGFTFHLAVKLTGGAGQATGTRPYIWPALASLLLVVDVDLLTYGARGSGIEAVAFAMFALAAIALLWSAPAGGEGPSRTTITRRVIGGIVLGLLSLTRPEGVLIAVLLLGLRAWQDRKAGRKSGQLLLASSLPYLGILLPYELWRVSFYGYPFPNTFYAKTGASMDLFERGLEYTWRFALDHWLPVAPTLILLVVAGAWWLLRLPGDKGLDNQKELRAALALFVIVYTVYIVVVGGDWFPAYRFFLPILAPFILLTVDALRVGLSRIDARSRSAYAASLVLTLIVAVHVANSLWQQRPTGALTDRLNGESAVVESWGGAGLWLRDNTPITTVTAAEAAGAIAYYSQRRVIDIFGLNDIHIARVPVADLGLGKAGHEKGDPVYVLNRQPDYIMISGSRRDYFASVEEQISSEYTEQPILSPVGMEVKWLRRRGP